LTQEFLCSECNHILYKGDILKTPQDIIRKFEGNCPNCGKELNLEEIEVEITSLDEVEKESSKKRRI